MAYIFLWFHYLNEMLKQLTETDLLYFLGQWKTRLHRYVIVSGTILKRTSIKIFIHTNKGESFYQSHYLIDHLLFYRDLFCYRKKKVRNQQKATGWLIYMRHWP